MNTHPALVRATAEVFRSFGAPKSSSRRAQGTAETSIGSSMSQDSGCTRRGQHRIRRPQPRRRLFHREPIGIQQAQSDWLPAALKRADIVVSMPKLKTHHWAGLTLSMKNLFGILPGIYYGWPKNRLHYAGIAESILDITATVRPQLAIVDGIVGMEGDGPLMGTAKPAHAIVIGTNLPAVDATAARLMGIDPWRVVYLAAASGRMGPIAERHIPQRGESIAGLARSFALIEPLEALLRPSRQLRF